MNLASQLREIREQRGIGIRVLAERSGIGKSTLSRWERGQCLPDIPELDAVLSCLNVSAGERNKLLELIPRPRSRRELKSSLFSGDLLRALRYRARLSLDEAAYRTQVSKTVLSRWESGTRTPSPEALTRTASLLDARQIEIEALAQGVSLWHTHDDSIEARLDQLQQAVREGSAEPLDLEFISLEYSARHEAHERPAVHELAGRVRGLYIEWLGWWYRDREAALWADRQLPHIARSGHLPIWGRVIRAKNVFMSEFGPKEPSQRIRVLDSALATLNGTSSEAFVRRELASELLGIGSFPAAIEQIEKARLCVELVEDAETHHYCCDMIQTAIWLASGKIDRAMRSLPNLVPADPYLRVSSTVGRSRVLVAAGQTELAQRELEQVRNECIANGYPHFARSAEEELTHLATSA